MPKRTWIGQPEGSRAVRGAAQRGRLEGEGGAHLERRRRARARERSAVAAASPATTRTGRSPQLRARAKELGIRGYSGKRKAELISMLRNH